jgi:putative FmdB family regulatory protein
MPVYDYLCRDCGPFSETRPMAQYEDPCDCPGCGTSSERVMLTVPNIFSMSAARRTAFATNEKSAHAPKVSTKDERAAKAHGAGCSCCSGKKGKSSAVYAADGSKTFPSKRPWMISH